MSKNSTFTQNQFIILIGLVFIIFFIFGIAVLYLFFGKTSPIIASSPTESVTSSVNVLVLPTNLLLTSTIVPTYEYHPTFTPIPSPTSFVVAPIERPTEKPQQVQNNPAPANNPPSVNSAPDCSAELDYADAMHKYYLDSIDYIHSPMIDYYQYMLDEATRNRDALGVLQAQDGLDNEMKQVNAEKNSENKRYKAERASIKANCY